MGALEEGDGELILKGGGELSLKFWPGDGDISELFITSASMCPYLTLQLHIRSANIHSRPYFIFQLQAMSNFQAKSFGIVSMAFPGG